MSILIRKKGQPPACVEKNAYRDEAELQRHLSETPEVIPLPGIRRSGDLLVLARDFTTPGGTVEILATDRDGTLYLIETTLYKCKDKRLTIAQLMDQGAALWSDAAGVYSRLLEELRSHHKKSPEALLDEAFGMDEDESRALLATLFRRLEDGDLRFVVLVDELTAGLKDLIRFVNEHCRFRVYGVELAYYRHKYVEVIIPTVFGAEGHTERRPTPNEAPGEESAPKTTASADEEDTKDDDQESIKAAS